MPTDLPGNLLQARGTLENLRKKGLAEQPKGSKGFRATKEGVYLIAQARNLWNTTKAKK